MDDYTKALIRYRFEDLRKKNPNKIIWNWMVGYLVSLYDMGHITLDECDKAVKDIDVLIAEQNTKAKAVQKMCEEQWKKQGLCVAEVVEDGND